MSRFLIQPHTRLQEWVADERGFFRDEGLDYEFQTESLAGGSITTAAGSSSVAPGDAAPASARTGAFEDMERGRTCDVSSACHWAVNAAAATAHGTMYGRAYSMCESGIFVAQDSPYRKPEDLAGVQVGVGYHSGSHYSAIQGLEPFLNRSDISLAFVGLPFDRVRLMLRGEIAAANVFGPGYYLLEQAGCRKVVDTTFMMGFLVADDADREDVERYFRALRRAQREIDLRAEPYKHYWQRELPQDLHSVADVRRFGPGERIVFEPYTREMYERTHQWMTAWELLDLGMASRSYDAAVVS
ncbi:MAG TPA: hypothetical protein VE219_00720 [Candidatus Sulfotelmatobacter sp.]|nr:hypothetical protein [Candidatus Sulfotelmatobacter sp.]